MNIKKIANQLKRKYLTSNPFELAKCLNIIVIRAPLGKLAGCYMYKRRNRIIYINSDIEDEGFLYEVKMCIRDSVQTVRLPYLRQRIL